jgi:hypothetical protein
VNVGIYRVFVYVIGAKVESYVRGRGWNRVKMWNRFRIKYDERSM